MTTQSAKEWKPPNLKKPENYSQTVTYCLEMGLTKALVLHTDLSPDQIEEVLKYSALYFTQEMARWLQERREERVRSNQGAVEETGQDSAGAGPVDQGPVGGTG